MGTCYYTFVITIDCTMARVTPNINYEFWVTMMCQYRLPDCNTVHTTVLRDTDGGRAVPVWGQGVYSNSVPSARYRYNKTALKIVN